MTKGTTTTAKRMAGENFKKIDMKRKRFSRGSNKGFKRYKKTPKYVRDNPENKIAREKERDEYHFTDSESDADDLGMGLDLTDLISMTEDNSKKQREHIAMTQDSVCPLFNNDTYDETKLNDALAELRYSTFRPNQLETIKRILFGRSTLFISPTGSGKSLCYQLPALLYWRHRRYMTIVVSPLISLMEDQMNNFPPALKAVCLHSGHPKKQRALAIKQLVEGEAQVVFISPEAIVGGILDLDDLRNLPPVGFVCIDEAHCLSEWSHNFRPAYLQFFKILHDHLNIKTYLGLTATSTKATSFAIARTLIINPDTDVIGTTTIPDNLILSVSYEVDKEKAIIALLKTPTFIRMPSIIIYCNRRDETEMVASRIRTALQNISTLVEIPERIKSKTNSTKATETTNDDSIRSNGSNSSNCSSDKNYMKLSWRAEPYHAGLCTETRKRIQRQFIKGEIRVVVATIAFGMGINKADIRAIIHYDMPSSFESYVQEIGRAGRDGKPAQCHMFLKTDKTDLFYQQRNIYSSVTETENLKKLTEHLIKPCKCRRLAKQDAIDKLEQLNQMDPHRITNSQKTNFTSIPVVKKKSEEGSDSESEDEDINLVGTSNMGKENSPVKFVRESVVKKHRPCEGHEISFPVDETTKEINLKAESIITLICQLQQAYPQLQIKQFPPVRPNCDLLCYKGPSQMEELAKKSQPVEIALNKYKLVQIKAHGRESYKVPKRMSFDAVEVASAMGVPYSDVVRLLKKTEWELVEETGRFRRSQVRVQFEGNAFHMKIVGDLNEEEVEEINKFLIDFNALYEKVERNRVAKVYHTFRRHCIDVDKMNDKTIRLETSSKLKASLNAYFDPSLTQQQQQQTIDESLNNNNLDNNSNDKSHEDELDNDNEVVKMTMNKKKEIEKSARDFISLHRSTLGDKLTTWTIARIFQGISTPNFPAEHWGMNRKWWRIHPDVDFRYLSSIINDELLKQRMFNHHNSGSVGC